MSKVPLRISCDSIAYRRGFIEVANIHNRHVNIEAWQVVPGTSPLPPWVDDASLAEDEVDGNVELELTPSLARELANALLKAAEAAESKLADELQDSKDSEPGA
jgi:hypothetical protein